MINIVFVLLIIGILSITIAWIQSLVVCSPKVIYKYIPKNYLDIQFDDENVPSKIYKDMFIKSSPWIGGFSLGNKGLKKSDNKG